MDKVVILILLILFQQLPIVAESINNNVCENLYVQGIKLYNQKKYNEAIKYFTESIKNNSHNFSAVYYLGLSYQANKQYDLAAFNYNKIIELAPKSEAFGLAKIALSQLSNLDMQKNVRSSFNRKSSLINMPQNKPNVDDRVRKLPDLAIINFTYNAVIKKMIIDGNVDGSNLQLIFNPGVKGIYFSKAQLNNLGLNLNFDSKIKHVDAIGATDAQNGQIVKIKLTLGTIEYEDVLATIVETLPFDYPVVGDVFSDNYYLGVDNAQSIIKFIKKDQKLADGFDLPFIYVNDKILVNVELNSISTPMILDTASPGLSFTDEQASLARVFIPKTSRFVKTNGLSGFGEGRIGYLDYVKLGPILATNVQVVVRSALGKYPILGQSFFNGWEYIILNDKKIIRLLNH